MRNLFLLCATGLVLLSSFEGRAQAQEIVRKEHRAVKLADGQTIKIDGKMDEEAWASANEVTGFEGFFPPTGKPSPVKNTVRVLYDKKAVYFAARLAFNPGDTEGVVPLLRDDDKNRSEAFALKVDVTRDGRTSYIFSLTSNNRQADRVNLNSGAEQLVGWDALWESETTVHDDHWIAEIRIPFAALGLQPGATDFGVQYIRHHIGSRSFYAWWTFVNASFPLSWTPHFGLVTGLEGIETGRPYMLTPYVRASTDLDAANREGIRGGFDTKLKAGIDANFRISSNIWASTTFLPDFGDIDLDDVILNLDRFELLLPEKRPFFLTGLSIYDFGHEFGSQLFTSRRIGFNPAVGFLPLMGGLKVFGRSGPVAIGLLNVISEEPRTNWHVGRVKYETGKGSLGIMSTAETGLGQGENANRGAMGIDGDINLLENKLNLAAAGSVSGGENAATALSTQTLATWRGRQFRPSLSNLWVQSDYNPPAGFLARSGIFQTNLRMPYFIYGKRGFREFQVQPFGTLILDDKLDQNLGYVAGMFVNGQRQDYNISLSTNYKEDVVRNDFNLFGRAPIPAGTYVGPQAFLTLDRARGLEPFISVTGGYNAGFFGGDLSELSYTTQIGAIPWVLLNATVRHLRVNVPGTDPFFTHQVVGGITISGSPNWVFDSSPRWDSNSDDITGLARLKWFVDRRTLLAVVYQNDVIGGVRSQTGVAKLTITMDGLLPK